MGKPNPYIPAKKLYLTNNFNYLCDSTMGRLVLKKSIMGRWMKENKLIN